MEKLTADSLFTFVPLATPGANFSACRKQLGGRCLSGALKTQIADVAMTIETKHVCRLLCKKFMS